MIYINSSYFFWLFDNRLFIYYLNQNKYLQLNNNKNPNNRLKKYNYKRIFSTSNNSLVSLTKRFSHSFLNFSKIK